MKLNEARQQFISSWGAFGTHWGINRTMAQIHALLMISPDPLSQDEIMQQLNISRGNVNMNIRDLIDWGLIDRIIKPGERKEFFSAEKDIWKAFREAYNSEPFVRIVKEKTGLYRYPEPKILSGSNYADVGFEFDPKTNRVVCLCAIDNLMKGAAGTAMQCANIMMGWEETLGLEFPGLHPI